MGKRKSPLKATSAKKKKEPLPTKFRCIFCDHEASVHVQVSKKAGVGQLECDYCYKSFQCPINYLSDTVDVYSAWVDAAEHLEKERSAEKSEKASESSTPPHSTQKPKPSRRTWLGQPIGYTVKKKD